MNEAELFSCVINAGEGIRATTKLLRAMSVVVA